jgi:hypothetical protein
MKKLGVRIVREHGLAVTGTLGVLALLRGLFLGFIELDKSRDVLQELWWQLLPAKNPRRYRKRNRGAGPVLAIGVDMRVPEKARNIGAPALPAALALEGRCSVRVAH